MDLGKYLRSLDQAVARGNGVEAARLMALPLPLTAASRQTQSLLSDQASAKGQGLARFCSDSMNDKELAGAVAGRLQALVHLFNNDFDSAFRHEHGAYNVTLEWFSSRSESQTQAAVPVLVRVSDNLRLLATMAEEAKGDISHDLLREALQDLTKGFTATAKDRTPLSSPGSKKRAILAVVNIVFKIYFKVNTLNLCSKMIKVVEMGGQVMANLAMFPVCDVVTYKYYIGRLNMYEDKYEEAREALRFALKHTPQSAIRNRQRILAILVPVEMCLGIMPTPLIGTKYGFYPYLRLAEATKTGNLRDFNAAFEEHRHVFIRLGVYLVLEQVRSIAYRCFFKRIKIITSSLQIKISSVEALLRWMGLDTDMDEIECILANLIYQEKVKGYISHQKRTLVVGKTAPFPIQSIVKRPKV